MKPSIQKACIFIITVCAFASIALPLLLVKSTIYPFIFSKIIFFRLLTEVAFFAWLPLALTNKNFRPQWRHPIVLWLSIFIGIMVVTMLTGVDPYRSFWSTQERMTGVLTMVHFWAWFLILSTVFQEWKQWKRFLLWSLGVSVLVGLSGFDLNQVKQSLFGSTNWQINATLGNPIYVGSYALFHVFLAFLFILTEKKWLRTIAIFCALFNFSILFLASSRGPLFAFIGAFALFCVILLIILPPSRYRKTVQVGFASLAVIGVLSYFFLTTPMGEPWGRKHLPFTIKKIIYFPTFETLTERAGLWSIGFKGFLDRPLQGWGWENFSYIFDAHYQPVVYGVSLRDTFIDRSHNQIVDILALTGIGGFISYMILWGWIVFLLLRKVFTKVVAFKSRLTYTAVFLFFIAYFIQNLSIFDTPASLIILYFGLGLLYFLTSERKTTEAGIQVYPLDIPRLASFLIVLVLISFGSYYANIRPFTLSSLTHSAAETVYSDFKKGIEQFRQALAVRDFTNSENRSLLLNTFLPTLTNEPLPQEAVDLILPFLRSEIQKEVAENPGSFRSHYFASRFYRNTARYAPDHLAKALTEGKIAQSLSPERVEIYYELAEIYALQGDFDTAVQMARRVTQKDPKRAEAQFLLAAESLRAGQFEQAFEAAKAAGENGYPIYDDQLFVRIMIENLPDKKKVPEAIDYIDRVVSEHPRTPEYLIARIVVYKKAGEEKMAQVYLYDLKRRDPEAAKKAEEMLKGL